ncbi:hypothetical protein [Xanthomonas sp. fls2-241-TYG-148]|uniref:hypothetical protein n=1 Tax=Xanthomonas sp. fls2-241-TYG-148 TaxID=3040328 RepID=UPI00255704F9|nr:hypothetical protein [Xanthomonas sp. fls2-241-TYG-148]
MAVQTKRRRFSARLENRGPLIFDDAPATLRIGYIKLLLPTYVGESRSTRLARREPLGIDEVHELFLARCRIDGDPHEWGESSSWEALTTHLKSSCWAQFFDFVELLGEMLIEKNDCIPFDSPAKFDGYRVRINDLMDEENIGWQMDFHGELKRKIRAMDRSITSAEAALDGRFRSAREHYRRSMRYLLTHPVDEANSIREIISALESVTKVIVPKAATLGSGLKELRKKSNLNRWGLEIIEKLYAYSNESPFIRHGQINGVAPTRVEAEMIVQTALAMICYLIEAGGDNVERV